MVSSGRAKWHQGVLWSPQGGVTTIPVQLTHANRDGGNGAGCEGTGELRV